MKRREKRMLAVILALCMLASGCGGARSIEVTELNGNVEVTRENETRDAYVSEHLVTGEAVSVYENSNLLLLIDADKHLYADANTKFNLIADGKKKSTKTKIIVEEGTVLCGIDNKLGAKESFEVETPNALMAVRGTVFNVSVSYDTDGTLITKVSVTEGFVDVTCVENGVEKIVSLNVGEEVQISGSKENVTINVNENETAPVTVEEQPATTDTGAEEEDRITSRDDRRVEFHLPPEVYREGNYDFVVAKGTIRHFNEIFKEEYEAALNSSHGAGYTDQVLVLEEPVNGYTMFSAGGPWEDDTSYYDKEFTYTGLIYFMDTSTLWEYDLTPKCLGDPIPCISVLYMD